MHLFILDSGLHSRGAHNLVFAILISQEARKRGVDVTAFTNAAFESDAQDPFTARPMFRSSYYDSIGHDPVSSAVVSFRRLNAQFRRELDRIPKTTFAPSDVVWVPTISEKQLKALLEWIATFDAAEAPQFLITLVLPPGASYSPDEVLVYDTLRAWRYRSLLTNRDWLGRNVHFVATGRPIAADYSYLAKRRIPAHPLLLDPELRLVPSPDRTLLLYVGDATPRKGIQWVPKTLRLLAERLPDWKFLAHANDSANWTLKRPVNALRAMQSTMPEFELRTGFLEPAKHRLLFEQASVVLLGYDGNAYRHGVSGVLWEAIAAGRSLILPADTYLERDARAWQANYAAIDTVGPERIADGVVASLESGMLDAGQALVAARKFRAVNRVDLFVDHLLGLGSDAREAESRPRRRAPAQPVSRDPTPV